MGKFLSISGVVCLLLFGGVALSSAETNITITEFRQLYNSLLSGRTLVATDEEDGLTVTTERTFGPAVDVGGGDFEVSITTVVTKSKDGAQVQKITINILDRVNDIGGQPIISEETRKMTVEEPNAVPLDTDEIEFVGLFRVSKNARGGFDVHNFGLIPSVVVEDNANKITASNLSYSCYPEDGLTTCVLTVRDYNLGEYTPLVGYELLEPIGGDLVETARELKK